MKNSEKPAFPATINTIGGFKTRPKKYPGLTKREYFSAMAMQGFCTFRYGELNKDYYEWAAKNSIAMADTLSSELEKQ